ncbi:MAG: pyruvate, water dikinase regulatory protein [Berryella intestinalis]|uniref:pyruvate, water dikinase regulatory protein n=1 Tax=Berryella intestinalis TaxID=1531429 RepID=UPI002A5660D9|nr:pyruvate, water dikinase regulatory protein [Berryella intestinalis]MDD7369271.1 kinase/pyrophosphorylase [Berryella intestinalis]MDY3129239.1 pyruvate, water dikinase regulatory protein [Berryella intestinalis]
MPETETGGASVAFPMIYVISDSVGLTGQSIARAAAVQFGVEAPPVEVLSKVRSFEQIRSFLEEHVSQGVERSGDARLLLFYTLVTNELADRLRAYVADHPNIVAVDIMTPALKAIASMTGLAPSQLPGKLHVANQQYFSRIEAVEFTIAHDDGRNPHELAKADIVLLGVSRSSKTPLSIYLSQQGFKVANVPLDMHTEPPKEIYDVDPTRLFGLMTTPDVLVDIRKRRLGNACSVAGSYADPEYVYDDLERARALMRRLGCIVIHTERRAVEETAQEILAHFARNHPDVLGYR